MNNMCSSYRNCFCGHGNSGCLKCGACTLCISKQENDINNGKDSGYFIMNSDN